MFNHIQWMGLDGDCKKRPVMGGILYQPMGVVQLSIAIIGLVKFPHLHGKSRHCLRFVRAGHVVFRFRLDLLVSKQAHLLSVGRPDRFNVKVCSCVFCQCASICLAI